MVVRLWSPGRSAWLAVLTVATVLALFVQAMTFGARDAAAALPVAGTWSGTINYHAQGDWQYTIGYRPDGARTTMATSHHTLDWQVTVNDVVATQTLDQVYDGGEVALDSFAWSGSVPNAGGAGGCNYSATGSMSTPASGPFQFFGFDGDRHPWISGAAVVPLSLTRSSCVHGVIFGFSGPNAGTLWSGGGYDTYLFNGYPESVASPSFSLCSQPDVVTPAPLPAVNQSGQTVLVGTYQSDCSGQRTEWFGDSDVYHLSQVTGTYTYNLSFTPDPPPTNPTSNPTYDPTSNPTTYPTDVPTIDPPAEPCELSGFIDTDCDDLVDFLERAVGTNPLAPDTDGDELGDLEELILGYRPTDPGSNNKVKLIKAAAGERGYGGFSCGTAKRKWYASTLGSLHVDKGDYACVFMLGNEPTNEIFDYAKSQGLNPVETLPFLVARFMSDAVVSQKAGSAVDNVIGWRLKKKSKKAPRKALMDWAKNQVAHELVPEMAQSAFRVFRVSNAITSLGEIVALNLLPIGLALIYSSVRDKGACVQLVANVSDMSMRHWNLVYNPAHFSDDEMTKARVFTKEDHWYGDEAITHDVGMSCTSTGRVKANSNANEGNGVFESSKTFVF
jgi:hypothetical protein